MKHLKQNRKMKKSSTETIGVFNWSLPAYKAMDGTITCPNAGACKTGCYAMSGCFRFSNVKKKHQSNLDLTKNKNLFIKSINDDLVKAQKKVNKVVVRIHDSGDLYSADYLNSWFVIASMNPNIQFYTYTKMISMVEKHKSNKPTNLTVIYSMGGTEDHLINTLQHKHSKVFPTVEDLEAAGYKYVNDDDLLIFKTNKVGLVYHGQKKYENTQWERGL